MRHRRVDPAAPPWRAGDHRRQRRYLEQASSTSRSGKPGYAWLDTGTHDSLLDAASSSPRCRSARAPQVACPEEIAYRNGWIDAAELQQLAKPLVKNGYGQYLLSLLKQLPMQVIPTTS